jgi:hypothetical protein
MLPYSDRKVWLIRDGASGDLDKCAVKVSGTGYERFYWLFAQVLLTAQLGCAGLWQREGRR